MTKADTKISQRAQRRDFQAEWLRWGKPHDNPAPAGFLSSFEGYGNQAASKFMDLLT